MIGAGFGPGRSNQANRRGGRPPKPTSFPHLPNLPVVRAVCLAFHQNPQTLARMKCCGSASHVVDYPEAIAVEYIRTMTG